MAQGLSARIVGLAGNDPLFARIRQALRHALKAKARVDAHRDGGQRVQHVVLS